MKEFQNIPESSVFMDVERLLIKESEQLWRTRSDISVDKLDVQHERHIVVFKRTVQIFPFLKFKRPVITIFPPYNHTDVHIFDQRSKEFGIRLKEQLGLFWEFGLEYQHPGSEEEEELKYFRSFLTRRLASLGAGEPVPETPQEKYHEVLGRFAQEYKAFAEAKN